MSDKKEEKIKSVYQPGDVEVDGKVIKIKVSYILLLQISLSYLLFSRKQIMVAEISDLISMAEEEICLLLLFVLFPTLQLEKLI